MEGRTIMTKGLGGKNKPVTTFGKIDPHLKTWKYGGCGKYGCGMPSTPKEHKEAKKKARREAKEQAEEDKKFYKKVAIEVGKALFLIIFLAGIAWFLFWAANTPKIR